MSAKRTFPPNTSRADIFMYFIRVFLLKVVYGFATGNNNHEQCLNEALHAMTKHGISPMRLAKVSNALVALFDVINAEYDEIDKSGECPN